MDNREIAIQLSGVKKRYKLGQIGGGTLTADLQSWWARVRGKEDPNIPVGTDQRLVGKTFMALNGIDLTVCCGVLSRHTFEGCREKGGGALYFEQKKSLLARLPELVQPGDSVLVKASHSHHFEEIVQELEKLK